MLYIYTRIHWRPTYHSLIWPFAVYAKSYLHFPTSRSWKLKAFTVVDMVALRQSRGNDKAETKFTDISLRSLMEFFSLDVQHTRQHKRTRKCEVGGSYVGTHCNWTLMCGCYIWQGLQLKNGDRKHMGQNEVGLSVYKHTDYSRFN